MNPHYDLAIRGATLVTPEGVGEATIAVRAGRIVALLDPAIIVDAAEIIDARGLHAFPGAVDCHVHFRDPGNPEAEDFGSGTAAAVAGGVTTVLDMPNTIPPTTTAVRVAEKRAAAASRALCDFGLYGGITGENLADLHELAAAGIIGFKCYMGPSTGGLTYPGDELFLEALRRVAPTGLRTAVHAESETVIGRVAPALQASGRRDPAVWSDARPAEAEAAAVETAVDLARIAGAALHIAHVSAAASVDVLVAAQARRQNVTAEVTPHHLELDTDAYRRLGNAGRVNPPLRSRADRVALGAALVAGVIQMVASDHAPHPESARTGATIWECASGFSGVQLWFPLLVSRAQAGLLHLTDVPRLAAEAPAATWRLAGKGRLAAGYDADVALLDLARPTVVERQWLRGRSSNIAFDGWRLTCTPVFTLVRGHVQFAEGELTGRVIGRDVVSGTGAASATVTGAAGDR